MPFLLYRARSPERLSLVHEVKLAGTSGPFAAFVRSETARTAHSGDNGLGWHLSGTELVRLLGVAPAEHALVIDLKPKERRLVYLFRVRDVWGFSYEDWTPIALRLDALYDGESTDDPAAFKREFPLPRGDLEQVHEFLYLLGGTARGRWTWGLVGRVNGALLWPDALRFFMGQIMTDVPRANP